MSQKRLFFRNSTRKPLNLIRSPIFTNTVVNPLVFTILTEMMADEFNLLRPEIKNYKAEADADLIPACFCALYLLQVDLHCRRRGRYNFRKIKIATISVRMVQCP